MSAVGLTKAMEKQLRNLSIYSRTYVPPMQKKLRDSGLIDTNYNITPRGHAALAAPRMTLAQLNVLTEVEAGAVLYAKHAIPLFHCVKKGWVDDIGESLTPSGRKALNDIRAASGSELYKETME